VEIGSAGVKRARELHNPNLSGAASSRRARQIRHLRDLGVLRISRFSHRGHAVVEPLFIDAYGLQMGSHFNDGREE
jgi:hypothetical protein